MELSKRAELYCEAFPSYPPVVYAEGWLYGVWMIGNDYKGSGYYGSYPPRYLKRVMSMFPDAKRIVHVFSGSLTKEEVTVPGAECVYRVDIRDTGENLKHDGYFQIDVHLLSTYMENNYFDLAIADPPYSEEDAKKYGTPLANRNKVVQECVKILRPGGFLVWLDQVKPMYRKTEVKLVGTIGVDRSTNHRVRMVYIFEKRDPQR